MVDLTGVTLLDASGIGVLLATQHRAHAAGKKLSVSGAAGIALQVLEVTGMHKRLHGESIDEDPHSWRAGNWQGLRHGR